MKKIVFIFFIGLFFLQMSFSQEISINNVKKEGDRYYLKKDRSPVTGKVVSYYSKDHKRFEIEVKGGLKNGFERWWFKNGTLEMEVLFVDGREHGDFKQFFEDGKPYILSSYDKGRENGNWKQWYKNGKLSMDVNYQNGELHGKYLEYHENEAVKKEVYYENGIENGVFKEWYEDGSQRVDAVYKSGRFHGVVSKWNNKKELTYQVKFEEGIIVEVIK